MACEKEEHLVNKNNEQLPQNPKDMVQNKFIFQRSEEHTSELQSRE